MGALSKQEQYLLKEATRAIRRGKLATAAAYLRGLPEHPDVVSVREHLRELRSDRESYASMSQEERDAHDNL